MIFNYKNIFNIKIFKTSKKLYIFLKINLKHGLELQKQTQMQVLLWSQKQPMLN